MTKRQKFFSALGQFFKNVFTKNILLKIVALVFALLLWGYVLSEEKPKYVKRVIDVTVELQSESRLTEKGWEVVEINPPTVDVNVEAGIDMHSMLDSSRVKCYVDLGQVTTTDQDSDSKTIKLPIMTSIPEYGVLKGLSIEQAELTIERITSSKTMTATVLTEGSLPEIVKMNDTLPEYFECVPMKPVTIEPVRGLKSDIDRIASAEVKINLSAFDSDDLSQIPGKHSRIADVIFKDADGNTINSTATNGVKVQVYDIEIRRYKEVPIKLNLKLDESFDDDLYTYECEFADGAAQTVRIYGSANELAKVSELMTDPISPASEAGKTKLTVGLIVPDGAKVNLEQDTTSVDLTVAKREISDVKFDIPVKYSDPDRDMKVTEKTESIMIRVSGLKEAMDVFDPGWFTANADLHHYGEGKQNVPFLLLWKGINLHVQNYLTVESDDGGEPVIQVVLVAKNGATYRIELEENTVEVTLEAIRTEEPQG